MTILSLVFRLVSLFCYGKLSWTTNTEDSAEHKNIESSLIIFVQVRLVTAKTCGTCCSFCYLFMVSRISVSFRFRFRHIYKFLWWFQDLVMTEELTNPIETTYWKKKKKSYSWWVFSSWDGIVAYLRSDMKHCKTWFQRMHFYHYFVSYRYSQWK